MKLPAKLKPESVLAVVDTREQLPLDLSPLRSEVGTVAIERKSLPDLLGCIGTSRERFEREVQRLLAYPTRALVVESTWADLEQGEWRSRITSAAAIGSCLGWIASGLPIVMATDHARAGRYTGRLLFTSARRRFRETRQLLQGVTG